MISEVPLLYGKNEERVLRYALHQGGRFQRVASSSGNESTSQDLVEWNGQNHLVGSSSVSSLGDNSFLLTLLLDDSVIGIIHGNQRIEIDFQKRNSSVDEPFIIARIQCFDTDSNQLCLLVVDAKATLFTILLERDGLVPTKYNDLSVPKLLEDHDIDYSGAELHTTMIHLISPSTVIMGLSPYIFSLNGIGSSNPKPCIWSFSRVQEAMSTSMSSILNRAGTILLGQADIENSAMAPVAALSICNDMVFSLHADATLLQWRMDSDFVKPVEVYRIDCPLPAPQDWTTTAAPFSFAITSQQDEQCGEYIVVVHIQTRNTGSTLWVLQGENDVEFSKQLVVPTGVGSVSALHLQYPIPNLVVSTTKREASRALNYMQMRYSFESNRLSSTPVADSYVTLDNLAQAEWDSMFVLEEESIEKVDQLALRHLFLPVYPRATGTTTGPSAATIQAAVAKLVPGYLWDQQSTLPVQTLCAMQYWRRKENSTSTVPNVSVEILSEKKESVYESFAGSTVGTMEFDDDHNIITGGDQSDTTKAHIRRWKTLMRTILYQEAKQRCPLRIETLSNGSTVLVRTNLISFLVDGGDKAEYKSIDKAAMDLLFKIEEKNATKVQMLEAALMEVVTSLSLVLQEDHEDLNQIQAEMQSLGYLASETSDIDTLFRHMTPSELQEYIESTPWEVMLPGISRCTSTTVTTDTVVAPPHIRHGSASLVVRGVNAMRRLSLGRCLLLLTYYKEECQIQTMVFSKYLHTLACLWVFSQHVPMPSLSPGATFEDTPPPKRLSFGEFSRISILDGNSQQTTALDAHIIQRCQMISYNLPSHEQVMALAVSVLESTFRRAHNSASQDMLLPELGCLPSPSKEDIATDYPRLALRLFTVAVAFPPLNEVPGARNARAEATAECLLIEANGTCSEFMRERANYLLDPANETEEIDAFTIGETYESLLAAAKEIAPVSNLYDAEQEMRIKLQTMLYGTSDQEIRKDIRRLCEKKSVQMAFLPFFLGGGFPRLEPSQENSVKLLLRALLRLSTLINRLSIIESRTDRLGRFGNTESSVNLIAQTDRAILEIQTLFPERMYKVMPEYAMLWSRLFQYAEAAGDWSTALQSCISYPNSERKIQNFNQLVRGMIGAGAMGELLDICTVVGTFDLYEIATDALACSSTDSRFSPGSKLPDYLGCLYSLHAHGGDWKRAAQAMDLRYCDAVASLESTVLGVTDDTLAARDLPLSAMSTLCALNLVPDPAERFIVSGEFGLCPQIALLNDANEGVASRSILKRGRDSSKAPQQSSPSKAKNDRLSRFMAASDVRGRAVRSVAFETIFFGSKTVPLSASILNRSSPTDDRKIIDKLASFGFYPNAFLTAHAMTQYCDERFGASMPMGRDRLHDAYSHVILKYLIDIACENEVADTGQRREWPTLSQLQYTLNEVCFRNISAGSSYVSCPGYGSKDRVMKATRSLTATTLIRNVVLNRDQAGDPIALEVADAFLKTKDATLPKWLENRLLGLDSTRSGLFGNIIKESMQYADPSALCTLYMQRGRHIDACNLVSKILLGGDDGKRMKSMAASRVPENGGLVFVPYNKIDLLWNLVEHALRHSEICESTKSELRISRMKMEQALEFHFSMLNISEEGLASARALARARG